MRLLRGIGLGIAFMMLLLLFGLGGWALLPASTASLDGPRAIASVERIPLGGVPQSVLIRGVDTDKPVLLYLHGGPGGGMLPLARIWSEELEKHFVVVHWDQRGAGASCTDDVPEDSLTLDQIVADTLELSTLLGKRFGPGEKIYLLGHSWGSVVGTLAVQQRPDLFHAYIGVGQVAHGVRNEVESHRFVLEVARERGDTEAIAQLEAIYPPYAYDGSDRGLEIQRQWLVEYGGTVYDPDAFSRMLMPALFGREYTLGTRLGFPACFTNSMNRLWPAFLDVDFYSNVPKLDLPVYLLLGRFDYNTPFALAEKWAEGLQAPHVELIWLDGVAHMAPAEDPEAFQRALIDIVLADVSN